MEAFIGNPMIKALIILFFVSTTTAAGDAPFIIAHKKASLNRLKSGAERVSVTIDIYNQGFLTAYDLSLVDHSWPQDLFDVAIGNTTKSWERLDAGGSLSHSFELEAKKQGIFHGAPAVITFRVPTKASLQRLFRKYGSQISVISLVVLFIYIIASPSSSAKASKKKR